MLSNRVCLSNIRRRFDQAFYIGDTVYDAESAKTSGCTSIALTGGHQLSEALKQAEPHHLIDNLSEVRNIIGPADE
ncbi:HAD family hydrolase [Brevibacterium paucivorans]|uniref:HAD family hydrolase n=1 Tax=Brevibacterium paucivorans TaxID=170994 RepID=UPI003D2AB181